MATISSHVLDSVLGTHAAGIRVQCVRHSAVSASAHEAENGAEHVSVVESVVVFDKQADEQGRISEQVDIQVGTHLDTQVGTQVYTKENDAPSTLELIFHSKAYFESVSSYERKAQTDNVKAPGPQILDVVVIRLNLPDAQGNYHVPLMLSPQSYSVWWSAPTADS